MEGSEGPLPVAPDTRGLARAAEALRAGELVVFPTETVYGLGANALDRAAVRRIFDAKGRPADNPIIVHVLDALSARALASAWPDAAERLARAFWPGPLTLVLPRGEDVPADVSAGLASLALRVPRHPVARALLKGAGVPIAAPSANRSGRPSPTRVHDARADLGAAVAVYLDGGPAEVGVESSVVSLLEDRPLLLRPGGVPLEELRRVVGEVRVVDAAEPAAAVSPGTRHRHYAPRARVHVVDGGRAPLTARAAALRGAGRRVAVIASSESASADPDTVVPGRRDDVAAWSRTLFALLRDLDREGYDDVVVEALSEQGLGRAVMDRLRKAAEGSHEP